MHNSSAQDLSKDSETLEILNGVHDRLIGNRDGAVADYIPELANVDADKFGLSIATTNGAVYSVGDGRLNSQFSRYRRPLRIVWRWKSMEEKRSLNVLALNQAAMHSTASSLIHTPTGHSTRW